VKAAQARPTLWHAGTGGGQKRKGGREFFSHISFFFIGGDQRRKKKSQPLSSPPTTEKARGVEVWKRGANEMPPIFFIFMTKRMHLGERTFTIMWVRGRM